MAPHSSTGDAEGLERALSDAGLDVTVEGRGSLALLTLSPGGWDALDAAARRDIVARAREFGFSHTALEIPGAP